MYSAAARTAQRVCSGLKQFAEVEVVTFDYGQRHKLEIECAAAIAKDLGVQQTVLDMSLLNQLAPNALTRDDVAITHEEGELPSTFVDGRNLLFLSFAAIMAKQKVLATWSQVSARQTSADTRIAGIHL